MGCEVFLGHRSIQIKTGHIPFTMKVCIGPISRDRYVGLQTCGYTNHTKSLFSGISRFRSHK